MAVTQEYVDNLPSIYRDILAEFPALEPSRKIGYGLAFQTLFEALKDKKWSFGQIMQACEKMELGGAVTIKNRIFVHPTTIGEEIIAELTGKHAVPESVDDFPPIPSR